jgi:hypothetical protein
MAVPWLSLNSVSEPGRLEEYQVMFRESDQMLM